jgi:BirA family biotin operon repressor/biotin-[acetyl-CoA-carboxylase] ligase
LPQAPVHSPIGLPFLELQSVDSTNNYIRQLVHRHSIKSGTAVFAHEQRAGKGQRGKSWNSEKGANIILSILIHPAFIPLSASFRLSACIGVAVHEFFSYYAGDETRIKWPNDLYWRERKAGGVLIENIVKSRHSANTSTNTGNESWPWSIVGIGININQTVFPKELPNPVSLKQITGKNFDSIALAKELCGIIDKKIQLLRDNEFENIFQEYNNCLFKKNESVKLRTGGRVFEAVIKGVSPEGKLITRHAFEEAFDFGTLEWVI